MAIKIGGTTVIDDSRNITDNIGTIPASKISGAIPIGNLSTATTQAESDSSTKIATTAYVTNKITTLIGGAPSTLNDLNELAAAINDDANYNATLTTALATKLPLAGGTMTGNIAHAGNFTLDVAGDIILDADGGDLKFHDGGTHIGSIFNDTNNLAIYSKVNNADMKFIGVDGGSDVTALTFDMSDAGTAIFNNGVTAHKFVQTGTTGSYIYAASFSRSSTGIVTPDIWGTDDTFVIGTSSSTESVGFSGANAFFYGNVGIGTTSPQKKLEVTGDLQLDANNASIWLKSGAAGTDGRINWTYDTDSTVYASAGLDYDTRASTGFHLDVGYPITIDSSSSTGIKFITATSQRAVINNSGLSVTGNIAVSGTVDGRDVAADGTKLDGIETGATADQTAAQLLAAIKTVDVDGSSGLNAGRLDGHALTTASTASTVVERTSSGDINARLFRSEYDTTNSSIGYFMTQVDTASNNYMRPSTAAQVRSALNVENGATADQTKADIDALAVDAGTLDGIDSGSFLRSDATDYLNSVLYVRSDIRNETAHRDHGVFGHYDSNKTNHIWSMGSAYRTAADGADFGNLYGAAYKHTNNTTGGHMAHGHQMVWCQAGTGTSAIGTNLWTSGNVYVGGTVDGVDIAARDGVLTSTTTTANAALPKAGGTMTGELQLNARLDVGDGTNADTEIRIYKADNNVSDHIQFYNGTTRMGEIGCHDTTWLRINQSTSKNIYTPRYIRADAGFFVDGTAKGINGSGNFIGGTITGASDANVSNWNTAYTTANAALPKVGGTVTGNFILSADQSDVINISANSTSDNRGIAFNSRTAISADYNDGYLRLNNAGEFTNGIYTNGNILLGGSLTIEGTIVHNGDTNTYLQFHNADQWRVVTGGTERLEVNNTSMVVANTLSMNGHNIDMNNNDIVGVDQIVHEGDSNTYIRFHAADQFQVVTGGTERLEVNNSQITSAEPIHAPSFHGDGSALTGISAGGTGISSSIVFDEAGTYTWTTPSAVKLMIQAVGAGGSGGAATSGSGAAAGNNGGAVSGGSGGGYSRTIVELSSGTAITITVGAGGARATASVSWNSSTPSTVQGNNGGTTTVSASGMTTMSAGGGNGGRSVVTTSGGSMNFPSVSNAGTATGGTEANITGTPSTPFGGNQTINSDTQLLLPPGSFHSGFDYSRGIPTFAEAYAASSDSDLVRYRYFGAGTVESWVNNKRGQHWGQALNSHIKGMMLRANGRAAEVNSSADNPEIYTYTPGSGFVHCNASENPGLAASSRYPAAATYGTGGGGSMNFANGFTGGRTARSAPGGDGFVIITVLDL
jgi:hypothetical protein